MTQSTHALSDTHTKAVPSTNIGQHTRALNLYPLALALSRQQGAKSVQQIEIERLYLSAGHYHNDGRTLYTSMQDLCANAANLTYGGQIFVKLYTLFFLRQPSVIVSQKTGELLAVFLTKTFMADMQTYLKRLAAPLIDNALDDPDLTPRSEPGLLADKDVKALAAQGNLYAPDMLAMRVSLVMLFNWFVAADAIQSESLCRSVLRALSLIVDQAKTAYALFETHDNMFSYDALFDAASAALRKLAIMAEEKSALRIALQNIMASMRLDARTAHRFHAMGLTAILNRTILETPVDIALCLRRIDATFLKLNGSYPLDMDLKDLRVTIAEDGTILPDQAACAYGKLLIQYVREMVILSQVIA